MFSLNILIHTDIFMATSDLFYNKYSLNICIYSQLFNLKTFYFILAAPCCLQDLKFPHQGLNLLPLQWKYAILTWNTREVLTAIVFFLLFILYWL